MSEPTIKLNEIFYSIQGESSWAGQRCLFIRLTGCHLRCHYCDTAYAFHEGQRQTIDEVIEQVDRLAPPQCLVEVTGGEPLLQKHVHPLMSRLCDRGHTVLIETSGACDISLCDPRVIRIMDLKTPGSGEVERNQLANLDHLTSQDEIKFVLTNEDDYHWAKQMIQTHQLTQRVNAILMSSVQPITPTDELPGCDGLPIRQLAEWILRDHLDVRLQTQLHKLIWDPNARGV